MKRLAIVVILAGLAWSGWWGFAAWRHKAALEGWFEARRADGWTAEYDALRVRGFPNRLDATFEGLLLADPDGTTTWRAPFFQVLMLSYRRGHAILVWPDSQVLTRHGTSWSIDSDRMLASVIFEGDADLTLTRANFEARVLNLRSADGAAAMAALNLALARDGADSYRVTLSADGFAPGGPRPEGLSLPESFEALRADLGVTLDTPLSRNSLQDAAPRPTRLDLHLAEAVWGGLELKLAGAADVEVTGALNGQMSIKAVNWRDLVRVAETSGQLPQAVADTLEQALELAAGLSGNRETLDLTLKFDRGRTWLGLLPIGPAPRLPLP